MGFLYYALYGTNLECLPVLFHDGLELSELVPEYFQFPNVFCLIGDHIASPRIDGVALICYQSSHPAGDRLNSQSVFFKSSLV